jgi:hypothetical protein
MMKEFHVEKKPRSEKMKVTLSLPSDVYIEARVKALRERTTVSDLVTRWMDEYVKGKRS